MTPDTQLEPTASEFKNIRAVTTMLDTLEQGIFSFGADGICRSLHSKACLTLLESMPAGKPVVDVLCLSRDVRENVSGLLTLIFSDKRSTVFLEDFLDLLPRTFSHSQGRVVTLEYRPAYAEDAALDSILVIATDRTQEQEAIKLSRKRQDDATTILRMSNNRNVFTRFFQSASIYFSVAVQTLADHVPLENVKRDIHTLKGNASLFHLQSLVQNLHDIETALSEVTTIQEVRGILTQKLPATRKVLTEVKKEAVKILGDDFDRKGSTRTLSLDMLRSFAVDLKSAGQVDLAAKLITTMMGEPIRKPLGVLDIGLQEIADRYGKIIAPRVFTGENFLVLTENYEPLFNSFIHISRNIVAHAFDSNDDRQKHKKPPHLTVTIHTNKFNKSDKEWFSISITDDGAGINVPVVRKKLYSIMGQATADALSDEDIIQFIFEDNLSSRDDVDELAGRGIGMSAVKKEVEKLGGTIRAESQPGLSTKVIVDVPMLWS